MIEDRLCKTWSPEQIIGRELKEFISLKSSYVKEFYRRMKQFKSTGKWNISLEDFKRIMDVPVNYRMCDIDVKVLNAPLGILVVSCFIASSIELLLLSSSFIAT